MRTKIKYVECKVCELRVPEAKAAEHWQTAACQARVVNRGYEAKGWAQIDATRAKVIKDTNVPWEDALGAVHLEEVVTGKQTKGTHRYLKTAFVEKLHEVTFAPRSALRVLLATANLPSIDRAFRRRMLEALWDQSDDILAQIDTVKRLDGNVRAYLWKLVVAAEETKGAGKTGEAGRVMVDGEAIIDTRKTG